MFISGTEQAKIVIAEPEALLTDAAARDKATRHFFNRALREVREGDRA